MANNTNKERIVIVGGGFAGINFAKKIDKKRYHVTLIDKNNFHSFPPLFYQIASSGLESSSIAFPFRREMRQIKGVNYQMGQVKRVDTAAKTVSTQFKTIEYDHLIIAAGTTNNYFGIPNLRESVYTLKSMSEAQRLKSVILDRMERATLMDDVEERRKMLSFVVVGAGPTGVEIAGAIGEMKRYILKREYPEINQDDLSITLIEGVDRVLRTMSEKSSQKAHEYLGHLMVDVRLNVQMKSYEDKVATIVVDGKEEKLYAETLIWTAGITSIVIDGFSDDTYGPGHRFIVDEFNRVKGCDGVYAIGDIAYLTAEGWERGYPQLAQVAIQQARNLAKNLNRGSFYKPFSYVDKGTMATIGRNRAVADLTHGHFYGRPAWFMWMFIHLISILGMRNKINVLLNWVWAYFTYSTSLRLLELPSKWPKRRRWEMEED